MLCLTNTGFVRCYSLGSHKVCCALVFNFALFSNFLFCVLCLTNTGFVQCFPFGSRSLLDAFVVSNLCFACFISQTPGLCSAIPSAPVKFATELHACFPFGSRGLLHAFVVSNSCFVLFASSSSGLCTASPFGSPRVYTLLFYGVFFCYACFAQPAPVCAVIFFPGSFEFARLFCVLRSFPH